MDLSFGYLGGSRSEFPIKMQSNFPRNLHPIPGAFQGHPAPWGVSVMFSGGHIDDPIFQWPEGWTSRQPTLRVFNAAEDAFFHQGEGKNIDELDVLGSFVWKDI